MGIMNNLRWGLFDYQILLFYYWTCHNYCTTSVRAPSSNSRPSRIVRTLLQESVVVLSISTHLLTFECFVVGKETLSELKLFQIKVSMLKNAKNLNKLLKMIRFFIKKKLKIHLTNGSKRKQLNNTPSRIVRPLG